MVRHSQFPKALAFEIEILQTGAGLSLVNLCMCVPVDNFLGISRLSESLI